jgi:hypothetical protein
MLKKIQDLLRDRQCLTAKVIADTLIADKKAVNKLLYENRALFVVDDVFRWSLVNDTGTKAEIALIIKLGDHRWLTAELFESALRSTASPWEPKFQAVTFVVQEDCSIMLEALSLLLALCNQLSDGGKKVTIDFTSCKKTLSYLNRVGFFEHLRQAVAVLPRRPNISKAAVFQNNNEGVVELRSVSPIDSVKETLNLLVDHFVSCAGQQYFHAAFTPLSELLSNVREHSGVTVASFTGLQFYKRTNRIQIVISDNGLGIVGTLMPILQKKYPDVAQTISKSPFPSEVALLREVFSKGGISQVEVEGRGTGLFSSKMQAGKFNATISVRQESFVFKIRHDSIGVHFSHAMNLAKLPGTHICFDFVLDPSTYAG